MRRLASVALVMICLVAASSVRAAASRSAAADPGVTASSIKLGGVIDQTGRGTVVSIPILHGYQLAIKELNAHGGVNGRKILYTAASDNSDTSQTLPQLKQVVESDGVFAVMGVFGSDDANVAAPYLEGRHIPFFDPIGGGVDTRGKRWIWQTEPDYGREGAVMAKYVATKLHARRVGVLYQVGVGESQVAAIKKTLPTYDASVVGVAPYEGTDSNLSGQVIRLRSASPDMIVLNGTPVPTSAFLQYAQLLGYKPKDGFIANYPMGDPLWLKLIGSNGEGNYVSSYADLNGRSQIAHAYRNAIARYGGDKYSNYGLYGYFNANTMFRALKIAGRNLTRSRLQYTLDHAFRHYVTGATGNLDWTPTQHNGARQFKIYRIHNESFSPVTGWLNP